MIAFSSNGKQQYAQSNDTTDEQTTHYLKRGELARLRKENPPVTVSEVVLKQEVESQRP